MSLVGLNGSQKCYNRKNVIVGEEDKVYKKPSTALEIGAGVAGLSVAAPIQKFANKPFVKMAIKDMHSLAQNGDLYVKASKKALEQSGLAAKGVELVDVSKLSSKELAKFADGAIPSWLNKILPKKYRPIIEKKIQASLNTIKAGNNAAFLPNSNKILVNMKKMSGATFHEMGHALNKNSSVIGKALQKLRKPGMLLGSAALLIGAFKRKKVEGEEPKGISDRFTTFIKNNAGKLAFLGFVPTLVEEAMASIKGAKMAKPLVSADALKKINRVNGKAWLTYFAAAIGVGLAARTASWINDKIVSPKRIA